MSIFDIPLLKARVSMLAKRVCEVETWRRLADDLIAHGGDDVIKLEERLDEMERVNAAQAARIARLELAMGVAIEEREVQG